MDDLISRQAAIAVADYTDYTGLAIEDVKKVTDEVVKKLKQLPSAQPEIIRCKECKYWDFPGYCVDFMTQDENGFCSWAERRTDG